jgi:hypothetical protein
MKQPGIWEPPGREKSVGLKVITHNRRARNAQLDLRTIRSLVLRLNTNNPDMAATVVVAIRRCLASTGHDLNDLAALLANRRF